MREQYIFQAVPNKNVILHVQHKIEQNMAIFRAKIADNLPMERFLMVSLCQKLGPMWLLTVMRFFFAIEQILLHRTTLERIYPFVYGLCACQCQGEGAQQRAADNI